jgi:hypothetical protein
LAQEVLEQAYHLEHQGEVLLYFLLPLVVVEVVAMAQVGRAQWAQDKLAAAEAAVMVKILLVLMEVLEHLGKVLQVELIQVDLLLALAVEEAQVR